MESNGPRLFAGMLLEVVASLSPALAQVVTLEGL
jgi:hypothetical protein